MRERVLVIRAEGASVGGIRALEGRYPDLEFVYCESFLSGIVEASRGSVRAMLARVDGGPRRLAEAVGALREAGGREAKIVLCCAPEHEPQAREALSGGADDYVIEPVQAADVDRAIGYGRTDEVFSADLALPPSASMEELEGIGELLRMVDAPPRAILERAAELVRKAMLAGGASVVVEGTVARSGNFERAVLTAALRDRERVIGQVSVGQRQGIEGSRDGGKALLRSHEGTKPRSDEGQLRITNYELRERGDASSHEQPSPLPLSQGERGYTLGDAQKLERYAAVLSQVIGLASRQRELKRLAVVDEASGLPNRRYLREQLGAILRRAAVERFAVTVLLFDVDDFKTYNDRYGHAAGDEILRVAGELFRKHCREQDVVARYGGDEFAVVFYDPQGPREPGSKPPAEALFVLDRFKDELAALRLNVKTSKQQNVKTERGSRDRGNEGVASHEGTKARSHEGELRITNYELRGQPGGTEAAGTAHIAARQERGVGNSSCERPENADIESRPNDAARYPTITISGGLATYPWDGNTVDGLLAAADEALLAAKRAGKNRVFVVGE